MEFRGAWWSPTLFSRTLEQLRKFGMGHTLMDCKTDSDSLLYETLVTVTSFANMPDGGTILIGIDKRAHFRVTGLPNPQEFKEAISSKLETAVVPNPRIAFHDIKHDGKDILAIRVSPLPTEQLPAAFEGRAYIRQLPGDCVLSSQEVRLLRENRAAVQVDFPDLNELTIEDLDPSLVSDYLENLRS